MKADKSEKFRIVAEVILRSSSQKGVEQLKTSSIARKAKVSRAWIYKNVGTGTDALVSFAVDHFGRLFFELAHAQSGAAAEGPGQLVKRLTAEFSALLQYVGKYPGVATLYFRYKGGQGPVARRIAHWESLHETRESAQIRGAMGEAGRFEPGLVAEALGALRWGLVFSHVNGNLAKAGSFDDIQAIFARQAQALLGDSA